MDAHSRFILTALQSLLKAALMLCLPDRAHRNLKAALSSVDGMLNDYEEIRPIHHGKRAA